MAQTNCSDCGAPFPVHPSDYVGGTGYAVISNEGDRRVCYVCAGRRDSAEMIAAGRGVLYLVNLSEPGRIGRLDMWRDALTYVEPCNPASAPADPVPALIAAIAQLDPADRERLIAKLSGFVTITTEGAIDA